MTIVSIHKLSLANGMPEFRHVDNPLIYTPEKAHAAAMASKDSRYCLNGVHVSGKGATCTDRHRMHMIGEWHGAQAGAIVPRDAVLLALRLKTFIEVSPDLKQGKESFSCWRIRRPGFVAEGRCIEETFPDCGRVIPSYTDYHTVPSAWYKDLKTMAMGCTDKMRPGALLEPRGITHYRNGEVCMTTTDGLPLPVVLVSPRYMADALAFVGSGAGVAWGSCEDSLCGTTLLLRNGSRTAVVMSQHLRVLP